VLKKQDQTLAKQIYHQFILSSLREMYALYSSSSLPDNQTKVMLDSRSSKQIVQKNKEDGLTLPPLLSISSFYFDELRTVFDDMVLPSSFQAMTSAMKHTIMDIFLNICPLLVTKYTQAEMHRLFDIMIHQANEEGDLIRTAALRCQFILTYKPTSQIYLNQLHLLYRDILSQSGSKFLPTFIQKLQKPSEPSRKLIPLLSSVLIQAGQADFEEGYFESALHLYKNTIKLLEIGLLLVPNDEHVHKEEEKDEEQEEIEDVEVIQVSKQTLLREKLELQLMFSKYQYALSLHFTGKVELSIANLEECYTFYSTYFNPNLPPSQTSSYLSVRETTALMDGSIDPNSYREFSQGLLKESFMTNSVCAYRLSAICFLLGSSTLTVQLPQKAHFYLEQCLQYQQLILPRGRKNPSQSPFYHEEGFENRYEDLTSFTDTFFAHARTSTLSSNRNQALFFFMTLLFSTRNTRMKM
jgi:hypothetical protein